MYVCFYQVAFPAANPLLLNFSALLETITSMSLAAWLFLLVWVGVGQALNAGIYYQIGNPGVYYGFKMGHHVPWAYGFPFSVVTRLGSCNAEMCKMNKISFKVGFWKV